eukprot:2700941-Pleurochrysis_carterae.AAC.1
MVHILHEEIIHPHQLRRQRARSMARGVDSRALPLASFVRPSNRKQAKPDSGDAAADIPRIVDLAEHV